MASHNHSKTPRVSTPNSRKSIKPKGKPYWQLIDKGLYLGYRKRKTGGSWIARRFNNERKYEEETFGRADDQESADGITTFSHSQAIKNVWAWHKKATCIEEGIEDKTKGPYTVKKAIADYLEQYQGNPRARKDMEYRLSAFLLPNFGNLEIEKITTRRISKWHQDYAKIPARLRSKNGAKKLNVKQMDDDEAIRKRRATANRLLSVLKAVLNLAFREGRVSNDIAWRRVKPFRNVSAPVIRYIKEDECRRLINACNTDLRELVQAALFTGCRYGELARLTTSDFNQDAGTLTVRISKSGKPRHVILNDEGQTFFNHITIGRKSGDLIFVQSNESPWGRSHQTRPMKEACARANIEPSISFHILRHTHGSLLAMQGVPMAIIAHQLGHADTRMTEKHYAHLAPSYIADTIRQHMPTFGMEKCEKVVRIKG